MFAGWIRLAGIALVVTGMACCNAFALPPAFSKKAPESIKDLQEIQAHVQTLVKKTMPATVGIRIGASSGSGVIIDKEGHVLTAGHVSGEPNRDCQIILPDGRKLKAKTLGANRGIDSGLIQITDKGDFPFIEMGDSSEPKRGDWCLAIGHPGGFQTGRAPVVRLGRILELNPNFIRTDALLVGGDSGGPLFDMDGKVIAIHSRIGNSLFANIHVPVNTYRETWERLAKAEVWGGPLGGSDAYLGVQMDSIAKGCRVQVVAPESPAAKAGLQVNDLITKLDKLVIGTAEDLVNQIRNKRPGNEVSLEIRRGDETVVLRVVLGKRPG